ncbi:TadE/TadG family type IV pilus assembly protein [Pseudonocardia hydrocarbonoxydans]|uniref:TadE/TadG family type IV pilus assembly protein n=1 Tax=Pseudonocardia hydrocarbonoxydans TaxID=76726 RepID=UPI0031DBC7BC
MTTFQGAAVDDGECGGSPSVEAALLASVLGLLIVFAIAGSRLVAAEAGTDHAARAAARAASLQRDAAAAEFAGRTAADDSLTDQGLHCAELNIGVDTSGFAEPLGAPASVRATVRCVVSWSALGLPGDVAGPVAESSATSPIDRLRERA